MKLYNWNEVQEEINTGKTRDDCLALFGMNQSTWYLAAKAGHIVPVKIEKKSKPLSEILVTHSDYNRSRLKSRLISSGILINECQICGQKPTWAGEQLVLVLDHINGLAKDNRLENLRLLCPNCNSQQPTFAGRNIKRLKETRFES